MSQATIERAPRERPSSRPAPGAEPPVAVGAMDPLPPASIPPANGEAATKRPRPFLARPIPLTIVLLLAVAVAVGAAVYLVDAAHYESTDDAFVEGHVVPMSAQIAARVANVRVTDNQLVKGGEVLVDLDPTDYQVALDQARGTLAAMNGKLQQAQAQLPAAAAQRDEAQAEVDAAETNFANMDSDLKRYQSLDERARSKQQLDNALTAQKSGNAQVEEARAKLALAISQIATAQAAVVAARGDVEKAQADVKRAQVNLGYCQITAPEAGRVTRKAVEAGSYVGVGQTLLAIVPSDFWIIGNFKETQLSHMRPGQPVTVTIDAFPGRDFTGHVDSFQTGTGARFSALPAENATGNYVKVVQRVPVKITLDPGQLDNAELAISPGMSAEPRVRVK